MDPGLILKCCKILQKKIELKNDVICRKIIEARRYSFAYSRGANLKVKFDSSKKHPSPPYEGLNPPSLPQVMSTLELDDYG